MKKIKEIDFSECPMHIRQRFRYYECDYDPILMDREKFYSEVLGRESGDVYQSHNYRFARLYHGVRYLAVYQSGQRGAGIMYMSDGRFYYSVSVESEASFVCDLRIAGDIMWVEDCVSLNGDEKKYFGLHRDGAIKCVAKSLVVEDYQVKRLKYRSLSYLMDNSIDLSRWRGLIMMPCDHNQVDWVAPVWHWINPRSSDFKLLVSKVKPAGVDVVETEDPICVTVSGNLGFSHEMIVSGDRGKVLSCFSSWGKIRPAKACAFRFNPSIDELVFLGGLSTYKDYDTYEEYCDFKRRCISLSYLKMWRDHG